MLPIVPGYYPPTSECEVDLGHRQGGRREGVVARDGRAGGTHRAAVRGQGRTRCEGTRRAESAVLLHREDMKEFRESIDKAGGQRRNPAEPGESRIYFATPQVLNETRQLLALTDERRGLSPSNRVDAIGRTCPAGINPAARRPSPFCRRNSFRRTSRSAVFFATSCTGTRRRRRLRLHQGDQQAAWRTVPGTPASTPASSAVATSAGASGPAPDQSSSCHRVAAPSAEPRIRPGCGRIAWMSPKMPGSSGPKQRPRTVRPVRPPIAESRRPGCRAR